MGLAIAGAELATAEVLKIATLVNSLDHLHHHHHSLFVQQSPLSTASMLLI